jgi:Na+:H+ antiporter
VTHAWTTLAAISAPSGTDFEFFTLFVVILLGPIIFMRFRLPGLIGLLIGGFAIGGHGLGWIAAGNHTVPELGHLGLLYLMFVAGLELDLHVLQEYRRAAVGLGLLAFAIPAAAGFGVGELLGWSLPATFLLGALLSSHTLLVYPTLRDAGLGDNPAVASAVGATVLTDTLALIVLAIVAGTQTGSGSAVTVLVEIAIGFAVLLAAALVGLPRVVDASLRRWGSDPVARYLVILVALLLMAMLADVFGIEGIVGAFFAGLALNHLVPNEGPSMERVEFFGTAVFVPIFVVSIGLLLDPGVMFTGETLSLAAYICAAALLGKLAACWIAGTLLGFSRPERAAMYTLTAPQAAATLAVTLIGFEIGLFDTSVVNAVLVLILVSIVVSAVLADQVVKWLPPHVTARPRLGSKLVVVTSAAGPSDAAVRIATRLARPDGGHSDLLIACAEGEPQPDRLVLRAVAKRITGYGFEGHIHTEVDTVDHAVAKAVQVGGPSLVVVDDPTFDRAPSAVPLLVVGDGSARPEAVRVIAIQGDAAEIEAEIARRLLPGERRALRIRRRADEETLPPVPQPPV